MNLGSASTQGAAYTETTARSVRHGEAYTRLHGRWLVLARLGGMTVTVLSVGLFVIGLSSYFAFVQTPCMSTDTCTLNGALTLANMKTLQNLGISPAGYGAYIIACSVGASLVWVAVGLLIFWRRSDNWMMLLIALMLVTFGTNGTGGSTSILVRVSPVWNVPVAFLSFFAETSLAFFIYLFPSGRFVPRWIRWCAVGAVVYIVFEVVSDALGVPLTATVWPSWLTVPLFLSIVGSMLFGQVYRYRHLADSVQRQQIKWVVFGFSTTLVSGLGLLLPGAIFPPLNQFDSPYQIVVNGVYDLIFMPIPLSIGIAILRYRLWDIDIIINRTLVYGLLTLSIVALYILLVVGLGAFLQAQGNLGISLLATGLVAVLFHPLRNRLQRAVNRLMYGERDDPYRVLTRLGQRLEATLAPDTVLSAIVETVAQALKLPYAAITLQEENTLTLAASFGASRGGENLVRLPLVAQHEQVGELVLAPRAPGEPFTPADQRLLEDLSRQIGVAVYAVRLTADLKRLTLDLQRSRERLVTAREEERRRLRRDLHDGLGPQLASLTLKLETARNRLAQDALAQTLLSDLTQRTQATVADIRRLVYALRPPALDELGLVSALRELTLRSSDQVSMHLDAPAGLPELSAAVEVAIYRITQEALTNVVRHAHARHCDIRLTLDEPAGWLTLSIQDDGRGLSPSRGVGVGLVSMRERAEELGGTCTIEPVESGGTRVLARLTYTRTGRADPLVATASIVSQEK